MYNQEYGLIHSHSFLKIIFKSLRDSVHTMHTKVSLGSVETGRMSRNKIACDF